MPSDVWGAKLARSGSPAHSGAWSLAQTTRSTSGGWDLDSDAARYAPVSSTRTYTATIWVLATKAVKVKLNVDLLRPSGRYANSANGPSVTLAANTWTQLTLTGIRPATGQVSAAMAPTFSGATTGTIIYWDDMSLTST